MMTDLLGKTLNQYELVEVIGAGGLATVYKAYQPSLERWVAVKVLDAGYENMLARFQREAKAVALLRHRNILMIYDYGEAAGHAYIAMEFVEGGTLENHLQGQPLDWMKVVSLILPIAEALHYAHRHGLIHRDVKPSNILMPQPDWPLLADFGLVKVPNPDALLTGRDTVVGTPSYMPPEQVDGEAVDPRADMYSLGVIMFEMITGGLPFEYKSPNLLMLAHLSEPVTPPRELNPACPPELEQVILTALQKAPDDRYTNMRALVNALKEVVVGPLFSKPTSFPGTKPLPGLSPHQLAPSPKINPPAQNGHHTQIVPPPQDTARILLRDKGLTIDLPQPKASGLIIGRTYDQNQVDIDLGPHGGPEAGISRQHARLIHQEGQWLIGDLVSLNGTYVNGVKLTPGTFVPLKNGDVVRCSLLSFVFLLV